MPIVSTGDESRAVQPLAPEASGLFPRGVIVLSGPVRDVCDELTAAERALVVRAISKRQHEFATGRQLAHRILAQLGATAFPLLADADRAPLWPANIVGSISHAHGLCVVAAAPRGPLVGLGIDVEEAQAVRPDLWRRILCDDEERWLRTQPLAQQLPLAAVFFSAKEAVYKAQFPLTRARLGFHDVALELDVARGAFHARTPGFPKPLVGAYTVTPAWVLTGTTIVAGELPA